MVDKAILKSEIDSLKNTIKKLENKLLWYYIGSGFGILIAIGGIIYYAINPNVVAGSISLIFVGLLVLILNLISTSQNNKRIVQLNEDLKKSEELLNQEKDKIY